MYDTKGSLGATYRSLVDLRRGVCEGYNVSPLLEGNFTKKVTPPSYGPNGGKVERKLVMRGDPAPLKNLDPPMPPCTVIS